MTEPNIEALARQIAEQRVWDWVTGGEWYGYPGSLEEEREAKENMMPDARLEAMRIVNVLYPGTYSDEDFGV